MPVSFAFKLVLVCALLPGARALPAAEVLESVAAGRGGAARDVAIPPKHRETCIKKLVTSKGIIHDGVRTGWCPKAQLTALDWFYEYLKR